MLLNLHVKNLAIIDEVEVDFTNHLNILTGETGAGKSILIDSINIALGMKASGDMIRKGAEYGLVELIFHLDNEQAAVKLKELDIPAEEDMVIISRKLMKGRSICRVNGENVTMPVLKELAAYLINIHGQNEHQSLQYKSRHLEIVDRFAKDDIGNLKHKTASVCREYHDISKKISEAQIAGEERIREISFLEYEANEIEKVGLKEGEDEELEQKFKKLSNANAIMDGITNAWQILNGGSDSVLDGLSRAERMLGRLTEFDGELLDFYNQILDIDGLVNDLNRSLTDYTAGINCNIEEFAQVEERLNLINGLKLKYGNTISDIQSYYDKTVQKLDNYRNYEAYIEELHNKKKDLENRLGQLSQKLSGIRTKSAKVLEKNIKAALIDLNFLEVRFSIQFQRLDHYTENGYDEIEFYISVNPGEDLKPLGKVASGGELSRIMLAIKSVLASHDAVHTLIFDEIDAGVSGRTAQKVSEKLSVIAAARQVICITHLPQIAAMADSHFVIEKKADNSVTQTNIRRLKEEESVLELARILGGAKITDTVIKNAKEMKELAEHTKNSRF